MITKTTKLKDILKDKHECRQCGHCCSFGSGFLVGDDKKRIARFLEIEEEALEKVYLEEVKKFNTTRHRPKLIKENELPHGRCVFLKGKKCSIHEVKPLQCKVSNYGKSGDDINEWFHLNYFVDVNDPQSIREWTEHVRSRDGKTIPGGRPEELVKDKKKLREIKSYSDMKYDKNKIRDNAFS